MTPKQKKELLAVLGLGAILTHNGVEIDTEKFSKAQDALNKEFGGDGKKALGYVKKHFDKKLNKVLEDVKK